MRSAPSRRGFFILITMKYQLFTTVDITETGIYRGENDITRNQQQNFDTIIQTIGLCGNVYYDNSPMVLSSCTKFPNKTWFFEWYMEIDDLFRRDNDHIAVLKDLFQYVPFIPNLTETANFDTPVFKVYGNIIFDYTKPYGLRINT